MRGRGRAWQGACMAGGCEWQGGACMAGGVHGRVGMCGMGACMAGGMYGRGACMTGQMATAAGGMHPTVMHSC